MKCNTLRKEYGGEKIMFKKLKQKLSMARRGNIAMNSTLVAFILGLFAVGVLGVVYVIVISALGDSTSNATATEIVNNTLTLFSNFTGQFGTIGSVGGVLILLVLLAAAGVGIYGGYQAMRKR